MATTPRTTKADIDKISAEVASLQKDILKIGPLVERLDVTIEKLTVVASNVSQILAVQNQRLDSDEKAIIAIQDSIEKRREASDVNFKNLNDKFEDFKIAIETNRSNFTNSLDNIDDKLKDHSLKHTKLDKRLSNIERWSWLVIGGSAVLAFVLGNYSNIANIISALHRIFP